MNFEDVSKLTHDPADPNPWLAIYLDQSTPIRDEVKEAWLRDSSSRSRQFLLPFIRPLARLIIVVIQIMKVLVPSQWRAPYFLHKIIVFGLKNFVRADANWLILRHFHIGSEILAFIAANVDGVDVPLQPLRPKNLDELKDNVFVKHDLNLFNFVIHLNQQLRSQNKEFAAKTQLDLSMITTADFPIERPKEGIFNFIDLETAIELFTPAYQLFLTDRDFWRATNSLQLDETIGIYTAKILQSPEHLILLNNKHPLVQAITLTAAWRLLLHGLSAEMLHRLLELRRMELEQKAI